MANCRDTTRLLSERQDRDLDWGERVGVRLHLLHCVACTRFGRQLDLLRVACQQHDPLDTPNPPGPSPGTHP